MNSAEQRPSFLITIDTEGDDLWSKPRDITTGNAEFLPRFQDRCEHYGLRPTYLVDYEMAQSPAFQEFGMDLLRRDAGEIGMHLHAWNNPPLVPLTEDDYYFLPYLVEYPTEVIRQKITVMTGLLEDTFGVKMVSHRAGRWSFNAAYARMLVDQGYQVDCSVTPHVSWRNTPGDPRQPGGTDYTDFPEGAYFLDLTDIRRPGSSSLLELPTTIVEVHRNRVASVQRATRQLPLVRGGLRRMLPPAYWRSWLRPNGKNRTDLLRVLDCVLRRGQGYAQFMLHSSELMPGGSPTFTSPESIERLYDDLEVLFSAARQSFRGATLQEYHREFVAAGAAR